MTTELSTIQDNTGAHKHLGVFALCPDGGSLVNITLTPVLLSAQPSRTALSGAQKRRVAATCPCPHNPARSQVRDHR